MIRVIICDDQTVVREGLAAILSTDPEIEIVGLASNGRDALDMLQETQTDVVLMDLKMPVMDGMEALKAMKTLSPGLVTVIMSAFVGDESAKEAQERGAMAVVPKPLDLDKIIDLLESCHTPSKAHTSTLSTNR